MSNAFQFRLLSPAEARAERARLNSGILILDPRLAREVERQYAIATDPRICDVCEGQGEGLFEVVSFADPIWKRCWSCNSTGRALRNPALADIKRCAEEDAATEAGVQP